MNEQNLKIEMHGINKSFYRNKVLLDVDFNLINGEIHGIVGQNGAGKSTLIKILNGIHKRDSGEITIDGKNIVEDPINPRKHGISTVFQELSLIPHMTVAKNVFLCNEPKKGILVDDNYAVKRVNAILNELKIGLDIDPNEIVGNLDMSSSQIVEIVKCLSQKSNILIFDEPTASLTYKETEVLFEVMRNLKAKNISIILISHYLEDVIRICDRVTILRDGRKILTDYISNLTLDNIINAMVGKGKINNIVERKEIDTTSKPFFEIEYLKDDSKNKLKDVRFSVYKGEIVGIAGLLGTGKTELLNSIYGFDRKSKKSLKLEGKEIKINSTADALKNGIGLVPEDRKKQALVLDFSVRDNILLPILDKLKKFLFFVDDNKGNDIVKGFIKNLEIKTENIKQKVSSLSGGNQQKVVIAKVLTNELKILLLDDPCAGIDINSKIDIFKSISDFSESGKGVILVSSELSELLENCDRILILKDGKIKTEIGHAGVKKMNEEDLLKLL